MFAYLRDFLVRHRRKFMVTGVLVGGVFFTLKYAQRRLTEFQERKAREFLESSRRLQHFESTERTCNQVIVGMGAELYQVILRECNVEELVERLRQKPANKLELWEEMRVLAFTRIATFVYASSMLVIALRVQLNLLGGYLYREVTTEQQQISDELKQQYLSLIRHFLTDGVPELVKMLRLKVAGVIKQIPLTQQLNLSDVEHLCWSMQMSINGDLQTDPNSRMCKYLLPAQLTPEGTTQVLQQMFNETLDLLESDDAVTVCSNNICRGFSLVVDAISENWLPSGSPESVKDLDQTSATTSSTTNSSLNINNVSLPLAKIIPIVSGLTAKGFDSATRPQNLATSLLTFFLVTEKTKTLGANVYETFSTSQSLMS